jgi:hypothetical protein
MQLDRNPAAVLHDERGEDARALGGEQASGVFEAQPVGF